MKDKLLVIFVLAVCSAVLLGFSPAERLKIEEMVGREDYRKAEAYLENYLRENPENNEARFWLGRVYGWQGKFEQAQEEYEKLLDAEPENYDYLLGKASLYYWRGEFERALELTEEVVDNAPGYRDAYELKLRLLAGLKRSEEFQTVLQEARGRFENFIPPTGPELPASPWDLQLSGQYSALDSGYSDWQEQRLDIFYRQSGRIFRGGIRETDRFDRSDYEIGAEAGFIIAKNWRGRIGSEISTTGRILPDWQIEAGGSYSGYENLVLNLNLRRADYNGEKVDFITVSPALYRGDYRFFYALNRADNKEGGINFSHRVGVDYYYGPGSSTGVAAYSGDEVENLAGGELLEMEVEGFYIRGSHLFDKNWGINYRAGYHEQGEQYNRRDYSIGVIYNF